MKPKSHNLFHFTKSLETLKLVLKNGFWPRYCAEDVTWLGFPSHEFVAYPMVCFCDIPLSRIYEHVAFYGEYGVGLTRNWGERSDLNPVLYASGSSSIVRTFVELNRHANGIDDAQKNKALKDTTRYLLAYTKPTVGKMRVDNELRDKEFYQESEWRYVPKHEGVQDHLTKKAVTEALDKHNQVTLEKCMLKFGPSDIRYIFVKSDADIPGIVNFIQTELDNFSSADLKVLVSRVTSLETLSTDL